MKYLKNKPMKLMILLLAVTLQACGGGGGGSETVAEIQNTVPPVESGTLTVSITDAPGDFVTYAVDVVQLTLHRNNGDTVEALPLTTRIDFSELTEISELLTIATVPVGTYDSVVLTMDYSNSEIIVQDDAGNALAADVIDADGNTLEVFDLELRLTTSENIRISAGAPAAFSLDFDLDSSNDIDLTGTPTVTVDAILLATPELETDREHRVRGVLAEVNETDAAITLKVRPFRHRDGDFGRFKLNVDENTQYEVDGAGYTGEEGLRAVQNLEINAPVIANGQINGQSMMANIVLAGSSVPWTDTNVVKGIVIGRNGDNLVVRGARFEYTDGTDIYRGMGTVIMSENTVVTAAGIDNANLSTQSISVGAKITAFGELVDDNTLDSSAHRVVMHLNQFSAQVVDAEPLAVDLYLLNGRRPALFDFSGTGVDASMDADPDYYEIDTGLLSLNSIDSGDFVRVRGYVNEFGAAPSDFVSRTVIDVSVDQRAAFFKAYWEGGTPVPFHSISETLIDVDLSAARKNLNLHGLDVDVFADFDSVLLIAPNSAQGVYSVKVRGNDQIHLYRSFADLSSELQRQLEQGNSLYYIATNGRYNLNNNELTIARGSFVFKSASETD